MPKLGTPRDRRRERQIHETDRDRRLDTAMIPKRFWDQTWDDYRPQVQVTVDGASTTLKQVLQDYAGSWDYQYEGLVILGTAGHGKTLGAALVAKQLCLEGVWVKFTTNADLGDQTRELFELQNLSGQGMESWMAYSNAKTRLEFIKDECDLLVLDDVGKEYRAASGWGDAQLHQLLRRRRDRDKATIITSNLSLSGWEGYNDAMLSFLHEVGGKQILEITGGTDFRRPTRRRSAR